MIDNRKSNFSIRTLLDSLGIHKNKEIVIETSSVCNVRCLWCWMYYFKKKELGLMSVANFKKFIDLNEDYLRMNKIMITPYHRGEPLLHPSFFEMIAYASSKNIKLSGIHTNLSVKVNLRQLINSALGHIVVNIGGITKEVHESVMINSEFDLVVKNLEEIIALNQKNKPIFLKMNATKHNLHQLESLPNFFKKLGGNPDLAIVGTVGFTLPAEATLEERQEFLKNITGEGIGRYLRFYYKEDGKIFAKKDKCSFLCPTVKWNGSITICCHDQLNRINLGNAFKVPLADILMSRQYKLALTKGRKREFSFCEQCN